MLMALGSFLLFLGIFLIFIEVDAAQSGPNIEILEEMSEPLLIIQNNSTIANDSHTLGLNDYVKKLDTVYVFVTAYSSTPMETDDDPFITASGSFVHWGTAATNFLPFGTKIRVPEIFGEEVFIVKDRMHSSKKYVVDIWFPSRAQALDFGAHLAYIEILKD